ncbi:unnamed protein product [Agarophyton chilense]
MLAFAPQLLVKLQPQTPSSLPAEWKPNRFSSGPPRNNLRRRNPEHAVVAWLSKDPIQDSLIINSAKTSCLPVTTVYHQDPNAVARTARSVGSRTVYLSANRNQFCFQVLQKHDLLTIPVRVRKEGYHQKSFRNESLLHASVAVPAMGSASPLLFEKNGGAVTTFYDVDEKEQKGAGRLVPQKEVDNRPFSDKVISWLTKIYLPSGFPHTTTPDYISFPKYRTLQNLASAIMSVISTEALLFGLGLGKKVAAGAAATSWVLKDGASYLAKILYGSVFGSKFDDDPKSWRIAADIVEDVGGAIEILTPLFPLSYFLPLASLAVCLRGMSLMTGSATRHVVYRSLAASGMQNTGDIATKGESQGVTMKMLGLGLGIIISSRIGQKYYILLGAYGSLAAVHIAANWRSVQCVQFSFFNKQRASILIDSHLDSLQMPTPHDVSSIERIILPPWKGFEPSVKLGAGVAESVSTPADLEEARKLFRKEHFMIFVDKEKTMKILLRDTAKPTDVLRAYYTAKKLKRSNSKTKEALTESLKFMRKNVDSFLKETAAAGWDTRHMLLADDTVRIAC